MFSLWLNYKLFGVTVLSPFLSLVDVCVCAQLCPSPWTVVLQAPLSMGFCRQECWSGLSFPSPRDLPNPGMET